MRRTYRTNPPWQPPKLLQGLQAIPRPAKEGLATLAILPPPAKEALATLASHPSPAKERCATLARPLRPAKEASASVARPSLHPNRQRCIRPGWFSVGIRESGRSASAAGLGTAPRRPHANGRAPCSRPLPATHHPARCARPRMARSAAGSLRDQRSAGRWPLSLIAGNRARTLGARFYADSKPSPPRPRAELPSA
jgi:hypothetical protein